MKLELNQLERISTVEVLKMSGEGYNGNPSDFIDDNAKLWKHRFLISCAEMLTTIDWKTETAGNRKIKLTHSQVIDLYFAAQSQGQMHTSEQIRSFSRGLVYTSFTAILNWRTYGI